MKKYLEIVKSVSKLVQYKNIIAMPKFIIREKLPYQYSKEDYNNDKKSILKVINHPYIIYKSIN